MKKFLSIMMFALLYGACQDITVGYLDVENAAYNPDSLVVRLHPDTLGIDANRVKWGQPWMSSRIEGVEGTQQIYLSVRNITSSDGGDPESLRKYFWLRNDGTFFVPLKNEVVPGRYSISIDFKNEGYQKFKDNIFTIIVVDR